MPINEKKEQNSNIDNLTNPKLQLLQHANYEKITKKYNNNNNSFINVLKL